jgi:hypothetical protein
LHISDTLAVSTSATISSWMPSTRGTVSWAMAGAAIVFAAGGAAVLILDLGVGWLWAAIGLFMVARLVGLGTRFTTRKWAITGASR